MIERYHLQILTKRMNEPRKFIQVILGPRQTGKTTLATQFLKKSSFPGIYESADAVPAGNQQWLEQIWETARLKMKRLDVIELILVIDEIQKIPGWSDMVKKLWDEDSRNDLKLKVVLLGSSRLLLQSGLIESLAGRFETIYMGHWSFSEMKDAFNWNAEQYAWFGRYSYAYPHRQTRIIKATFRTWMPVFRPDSLPYKNTRPTTGCRQYHNLVSLS